MKDKINVGDLIMVWKGKPQQKLYYVINKLGENKDIVALCPIGEEQPNKDYIWVEEDLKGWKVK